jgi:hypothetical protein
MWPYAYDKAFFEAHTWGEKSKQYVSSQSLHAFLVASVGASLRYCMSEHNTLALCQGFLPRIIQTSLHLPLSLSVFSAVFISPSEHSCPSLVYRPCCHGSLECSYVSIFVKHFGYFSSPSATALKFPIILPIYHFSEYELSNM